MSDTTNVQTVQDAYDCFGRGDVAGILERLTDDVVWHVAPVDGATYTGTRHGKAGAAQFFQLMVELEETSLFEPREFVAQNDKVVVVGHYAARVRSTGRAYETYWVHVFTFRDGKISSFREYTDTGAIHGAFAGSEVAAVSPH